MFKSSKISKTAVPMADNCNVSYLFWSSFMMFWSNISATMDSSAYFF